ncbi:MAG: Crp/Fnr family transcriptional regulator [Eubacteriaceae bacterium]|nr:Crp/Fnr family transcriptional regulator [Eubacteriaceae bacterium]
MNNPKRSVPYHIQGNFASYTKKLSLSFEQTALSEGDYLLSPQIKTRETYFIKEGIAAFGVSEAGKERIICFIGKNQFIPLPYKNGGISPFNYKGIFVKAQTPLKLIKLPPSACEELLKEEAFTAKALDSLSELSALLLYTNMTLSFKEPFERICAFISEYTTTLIPLGIRLSQQQIAGIAGTTLLEVARTLRYLRDRGCISTSLKMITILDAVKFEELRKIGKREKTSLAQASGELA